MLDEGVTYMNNASLGLPPREVARAVCDGYEAISREPLHGKHDLQEVIAQDVVPGLASFVGADADEISLTRNATEGLHLQAVGLQLEPGDEVLITTQEHPAGNAPWRFREERDGIRVTEVFVPSPLPSADEVVELMAAAVTARTRAISFCHATRGRSRLSGESADRDGSRSWPFMSRGWGPGAGSIPHRSARSRLRRVLGQPSQVGVRSSRDRIHVRERGGSRSDPPPRLPRMRRSKLLRWLLAARRTSRCEPPWPPPWTSATRWDSTGLSVVAATSPITSRLACSRSRASPS